jgi:hypothetical protein
MDPAERVGMEDDVLPLHIGLDVLGGEVGAETRLTVPVVMRSTTSGFEDQASAHHRLALG